MMLRMLFAFDRGHTINGYPAAVTALTLSTGSSPQHKDLSGSSSAKELWTKGEAV